MILLGDAAEPLSGLVAERLVALGQRVRAVAWSARGEARLAGHGMEVVRVDPDRPADARRALQDVRRVLLEARPRPPQEARHVALTEAMAPGRIHVVHATPFGTAPDAEAALLRRHALVWDRLARARLRATRVIVHLYMEDLLAFAPDLRDGEEIVHAIRDAAVPYVDVRDAASAVASLLGRAAPGGQTFVLTGRRTVTMDEVAQILSRVLDRQVTARQVGLDALAARLSGMQAPLRDARLALSAVYRRFGDRAPATDDVARLSGTEPRTVEGFLSQHASLFRSGRPLAWMPTDPETEAILHPLSW